MKRVISVSVGELVLKKGNRAYFENKLIGQMKKTISDVGFSNFYKDQGKIYIEADYENFDLIINRLQKVFGIVYISPCIKVNKNMEEIKLAALEIMKEEYRENKDITFKVETNRSDKQFELKSPEVSRILGGEILKNFNDLKVDVHSPDVTVNVDIKQNAYIYTKKIEGYRGLPVGSNGRGLLLLSGGIDSPVAGFTMAKRGVKIDCVHYHSYPFTSDRSEEKVKELAKILSRYVGKINFYSVNILNIQKEINKNCPENEMTILSRRFMMRIANEIAKSQNHQALITGESLGQVASQTIEGLTVTTDVVDMPILRPLIGIDKIDIIDIARDIETYETSILPFDDCCTVFLPKHPVINPKVEDIRKSEEAIDVDKLVKEAIDNMTITTIE
ncbi:MAG TPA: tRNA uracil 4-sulfurtransferase ThiI [Tissierellaceae bacterium]